MIPAQPLPNEDERIGDLLKYEILDTPPELDFDEIVKLASLICKSEIALISLVDDHRQWFKAKHGLEATETEKEIAFCSHAINQDDIFEVQDASQDERFVDNPLVINEPKIRFYAGKPICSSNGNKLGTLCIIDRFPRKLNEFEQNILTVLAKQVEKQLELRLKIKELKQSLNLIEEQNKILHSTNLIKDQALSVLSHDLRSPLNNLQTILELVDNNIIEIDNATELINEIRPNITQTVLQLEDVLNWATHQMSGHEVNWQVFDADSMINNCLNWVKDSAQQKEIFLIKNVCHNLNIFGDRQLIEIVLRNLLNNAIKFTLKNGQVTIFALEELDEVIIGVKDTGIGIDEANLTRVLSKETSYTTLGTAREKGTGLGLMLCQTYLHKMKTKLKVENELSKGCKFFFSLPKYKK